MFEKFNIFTNNTIYFIGVLTLWKKDHWFRLPTFSLRVSCLLLAATEDETRSF